MTGRTPKIVVVGPVYVDMAVKCKSLPTQGQVVEGTSFSCTLAGEGVGRAVMAAQCGCEVHLIAKVGDDPQGQMALEMLEARGVNTKFVYRAQAMSSGVRVTFVDSMGENTSCICAGTNRALSPDEITFVAAEQVIAEADVCLICDDIPENVIATAIKTAKLYKTKVILEKRLEVHDCGMSSEFGCPNECYLADVLVPRFHSTTEMNELTAGTVHKLKRLGSDLVAAGIESVVIKMAARGAFVASRDDSWQIPGFTIDCVDRTCCSDAFVGALAASMGTGDPLQKAVRFASAAGALACTRFGSLDSLPTKQEIIEMLLNQPD